MPTNTVTPDWLVRLEQLAGDLRAENDALGLRSNDPLETAVDRLRSRVRDLEAKRAKATPELILIRGGLDLIRGGRDDA